MVYLSIWGYPYELRGNSPVYCGGVGAGFVLLFVPLYIFDRSGITSSVDSILDRHNFWIKGVSDLTNPNFYLQVEALGIYLTVWKYG